MIFRGPEPPIAIPEVPLTALLLERAAGRGSQAAFIDGPTGRTLTYAQWAAAVQRAAGGLAHRGFHKGDVLAIYCPNTPEYAVAFHAAALAGGITTTINPLYAVDELAFQLADARASLLLTVPPCVEKARAAAERSGVRELFVFGEAEHATPFSALLDSDRPLPVVAIDPRRDLIALPYSSGTTGLPKGVMLTHYNLVANVLQSEVALPLRDGETVLGVLPFFHIYGLVVIMNLCLHVGATIVTMPRFELEACLETLQKYRISYANVVPPVVLAFAKHPAVDKYDLSALKTIFSGAAPLGEAMANAAARRLNCRVLQGYGLTETSPVTHAARADSPNPRPASVGQPIPNTEAKVVDVATGAELGPGQDGEICVRGPQVMRGYLNQPEATSNMIDPDGWLHTGDIGHADEDGWFHIVDRVKELIKYKGMQIAPAELEAVLLSHPGIADAAVIPVADEHAGEVPKAYVVARGPLTNEEVMAFVAERVAPYKRLRQVEITDAIPKSPSGKILRRVLVERERQRAASA
jgi:acyl-CoA synthetase (AMP-forming)/AMP-acid ligase II